MIKNYVPVVVRTLKMTANPWEVQNTVQGRSRAVIGAVTNNVMDTSGKTYVELCEILFDLIGEGPYSRRHTCF